MKENLPSTRICLCSFKGKRDFVIFDERFGVYKQYFTIIEWEHKKTINEIKLLQNLIQLQLHLKKRWRGAQLPAFIAQQVNSFYNYTSKRQTFVFQTNWQKKYQWTLLGQSKALKSAFYMAHM